jgi:hypothetical protein
MCAKLLLPTPPTPPLLPDDAFEGEILVQDMLKAKVLRRQQQRLRHEQRAARRCCCCLLL